MKDCHPSPLQPEQLRLLLAGTWTAVLGDSVSRLFYAALLRAASADPSAAVVLGHRDFEHALPHGARASFVWAPFEANLSAAVEGWGRDGAPVPDGVVLGSSLWHMLHVGDAGVRREELQRLRRALVRAGRLEASAVAPHAGWQSEGRRRPLFFWQSTTALVSEKLLSEKKRQALTVDRIAQFDSDAAAALVLPEGPCLPLDVHGVTSGCGPHCSIDGMHFSNATFDVLIQQWGAALSFVAAHRSRSAARAVLTAIHT